MKKIALLLLAAVIFIQPDFAAADPGRKDMRLVLEKAKRDLTVWLNVIDEDMKNAAQSLSVLDFKSAVARKILGGLRIARPYIIDCSIIDTEGKMITVQPYEYKRYEGSDVSDQPQVIMIQKTKRPVMSAAFISVENTFSVDFEYPITGNGGEFRGSVSVLMKQGEFLSDIVGRIVKNTPFKIWITQTDGVILHSTYQHMISKNVFSDEFFSPLKSFVDLAKKIAVQRTGFGSYEFYENGERHDKTVARSMMWDTVRLYDNEWRIGVVEIEN
ncbi:MAG: hypothetical protein Q8O01_04935 [Candidatus Omnitrophota bacterium]|nr:hypothetical protein [Candidatus Omnitrophota bacterium]